MANTGAGPPPVSRAGFKDKRRGSMAILDTAEELVDSLDNLSVCLKHIEEKYIQDGTSSEGQEIDKSTSLFQKLKDNLENARDLTDSIKREKWRLSRRELSVELRMGELEDYKSHLKRDMTDMNQTVDVLSMRIVQLENALCEDQDIQETLEAENEQIKTRLKECETKLEQAEARNGVLEGEMKELRPQRSESMLQKLNYEMSTKIEVLQLENKSLKEMIREAHGSTSEPTTPTSPTPTTPTSPTAHTIDNSVVSAASSPVYARNVNSARSTTNSCPSPRLIKHTDSIEEYV